MVVHDKIEVFPIEIREKSVKVFVDKRGTFYAKIHDTTLHARDLDELQKKAMAATRKHQIRFQIPFTELSGSRVRHGVVVGMSADDKLMVHWEDGEKERVKEYSFRMKHQPLKAAEVETWKELQAKKREIEKAIDEFEKPKRLDVEKAAREKVKEQMSG